MKSGANLLQQDETRSSRNPGRATKRSEQKKENQLRERKNLSRAPGADRENITQGNPPQNGGSRTDAKWISEQRIGEQN
jgi:hypothetical protein